MSSSLTRIIRASSETHPLTEDAEEVQAEAADLQRYADKLKAELSNAEGCETLEDLAANLEAARDAYEAIKADLPRLAKKAAKILKDVKSKG